MAYTRFEDVSRQAHCSLLLAMSRVASLKPITIPRMELTAFVLCAKTEKHVEQQSRIPNSCFHLLDGFTNRTSLYKKHNQKICEIREQ